MALSEGDPRLGCPDAKDILDRTMYVIVLNLNDLISPLIGYLPPSPERPTLQLLLSVPWGCAITPIPKPTPKTYFVRLPW